ncbi:MAG: BrnT family toxin [Selenomonadaceae bacterium]|nr:BrnT family toxin [Selenomonadaceae bacterium]
MHWAAHLISKSTRKFLRQKIGLRINPRNNQFDFNDGAQIFFGDKDRRQVIGMVNEILFVIYTERGENIRLISARKAKPKERRIYYGNGDLYFA